MVSDGRVRRAVFEKPRVGILELFELGFHSLREAIVDHGIGRRRRGRWRRRGYRRGSGSRSNSLVEGGRGSPVRGASEGEKTLDRHD